MNGPRIFFAVTNVFLLALAIAAHTTGGNVTDGAWWILAAFNAISTLFLYFTKREKEPVYGVDRRKATEVC